MKKLLLFPCNGNALEAIGCLGDAYEFIGFIDDDVHKQGKLYNSFSVFSREALTRFPDAYILAVPGSPKSYTNRQALVESLAIPRKRFATVIHPKASVSKLATIGSNVLIMAGAVITGNARIGDHVCILPNTVIHHDVFIGAWTLIGASVVIAGNTTLGDNCYIGSGSRIINDIVIGNRALVGMGSTVLRFVPTDATVVGCPARQLLKDRYNPNNQKIKPKP